LANNHPVVSSDGAKLAYEEEMGEQRGIFSLSLRPGPGKPRVRQRMTDVSGWPYDWSADGEWLMHAVKNAKTERWEVAALQVRSGRRLVLAQHPTIDITMAQLSPDQNWLLAMAHSEGRMWVAVAPYRAGVAVRPEDWFTVSAESGWEDKARWSADGQLIYHVSDQDGFRCLWAQRVDAATRRRTGPPFGVFHSHAARTSLRNVDMGTFRIASGRERLVFPLAELRGNIWMRTLPGPR
jgi:Tol biopolymer transport system component